jgi:pre-60S factor REI1
MKRRVASLPPVSQETFNEKVLAAKATSSLAAAKASFEKTCLACQKSFYSENSYQNHVKSSKHKAREARMQKDIADDSSSVMSSTFSLGEPINKSQEGDSDVTKVTENLKTSTIEEEGEDEEELENDSEYSPSRCLFCNHKASDLQENTEHMRKSHGMFIPEKEYLVNLEGLIHYLYRKINENSECLYCHAIRNSPAGIRTHMRDKGHCMIAFETEEEQIEIGQYYDFRSTYSDDDAGSETSGAPENGGVKVAGSDGDDGWETETSASSVDENEDDDGWETDDVDSHKKAPVVYQTEYELHLPSGKSVGHRSLAKYYRQNLHNYPSIEERVARQLAIENGEVEEEKPRGRNPTRALVTRANGGLGMIGVTEDQKRMALTSERKERTRAIRQEVRYRERINRAGNNQKHFRDPLLQ